MDLSGHIYDFLESIKLSDLLDRKKLAGTGLPCSVLAKHSSHDETLAGNTGSELR
jgi:hypothetical protein